MLLLNFTPNLSDFFNTHGIFHQWMRTEVTRLTGWRAQDAELADEGNVRVNLFPVRFKFFLEADGNALGIEGVRFRKHDTEQCV